MTIIYFDDIIGKKFETITNNVFCLNHPTNCLIIGKTNSGKTNVVMKLIAKNSIYEKIHIYTNNIGYKINLRMMYLFILMKLILIKLISSMLT